ncbi:unnamed protein product [Ceratitis capitata]|uniref:(Mediterranean fruit fly) hypothetical protein n=1 Tax=Ceratitis capitata TaxID=7213 RepID=A0A811V6E8_CERCA|nr:unnamed protein product [Ceratitis capitata]
MTPVMGVHLNASPIWLLIGIFSPSLSSGMFVAERGGSSVGAANLPIGGWKCRARFREEIFYHQRYSSNNCLSWWKRDRSAASTSLLTTLTIREKSCQRKHF